jgi:hypothetical protein
VPELFIKMPMHCMLTAISGNFPDIAKHPEKFFFRNEFLVSCRVGRVGGIFYPSGEPISRQRLHRSPFGVVHYNFMSYFFVAAAISARK